MVRDVGSCLNCCENVNTVGGSISTTSAVGCCYGLGPLAWSYQISAQVNGATLEQQDKTLGSLSWQSCRRGPCLNATSQSSLGFFWVEL